MGFIPAEKTVKDVFFIFISNALSVVDNRERYLVFYMDCLYF